MPSGSVAPSPASLTALPGVATLLALVARGGRFGTAIALTVATAGLTAPLLSVAL